MTVETADRLTADDARRLTERIRVRLDRVSTAWVDLGEAITEAFQRRADLALGYGSWEAEDPCCSWCADTPHAPARCPRAGCPCANHTDTQPERTHR